MQNRRQYCRSHGDVVKNRIAETEHEAELLREYISSADGVEARRHPAPLGYPTRRPDRMPMTAQRTKGEFQ